MSIYKRGSVYWYSFVFRGERVQQTTRQGDRKVARQMEAAQRTALAKGEVGILERKPAPILKDFSQQFVDYVQTRSAEKPKTIQFYAQQMARLLEFEPLASARLDAIDESLIERFVQWRGASSRAGQVRTVLLKVRLQQDPTSLSARLPSTAAWRLCANCCVWPTNGASLTGFPGSASCQVSATESLF